MKAAASWFAELGFVIEDVSMNRVGWDLEARRKEAHLFIEVKGTSREVEDSLVEVTPNEYEKMTSDKHRAAYRLCVVTGCEKKPEVHVFAWSAERSAWDTGDGTYQLQIEERVAARISMSRGQG